MLNWFSKLSKNVKWGVNFRNRLPNPASKALEWWSRGPEFNSHEGGAIFWVSLFFSSLCCQLCIYYEKLECCNLFALKPDREMLTVKGDRSIFSCLNTSTYRSRCTVLHLDASWCQLKQNNTANGWKSIVLTDLLFAINKQQSVVLFSKKIPFNTQCK